MVQTIRMRRQGVGFGALGILAVLVSGGACSSSDKDSGGMLTSDGRGDNMSIDGDGSGVDMDGDSASAREGETIEPPAPPEVELDAKFELPHAGERYVYAVNPQSDTVAVIDAANLSIHTVPAGRQPRFLQTLAGKDSAIVLNVESNDATIIQTESGASEHWNVPIRPGANAIAVAPDGKHAVVYFDARYAGQGLSAGNFQDVTVLTIGDEGAEATQMTVGYRPSAVSFDAASTHAFVVTENGVSILDFAAVDEDGAGQAPTVSMGESIDDPGIDVSVTRDGQYAVGRQAGGRELRLVDLVSGDTSVLDLVDIVETALGMPERGMAGAGGAGGGGAPNPTGGIGGAGGDGTAGSTSVVGGAGVDSGGSAGLVGVAGAAGTAGVAGTAGADSADSAGAVGSSSSSGMAGSAGAVGSAGSSGVGTVGGGGLGGQGGVVSTSSGGTATASGGAVEPIPIPSTDLITDVDLSPDSSYLVAVVRYAGAVARIPVPAGFADPSLVELTFVPEGRIGQVTLANDGSRAVLFTTADPTDERLTILDFDDAAGPRATDLHKAVHQVAVSDDGLTALVVHQLTSGNVSDSTEERRVDQSQGYSLVNLETGFAKLEITPTQVVSYALVPDAGSVFLTFQAPAEVHRIGLADFVHRTIALASVPVAIGPVPQSENVFVSQIHPDGRITFIDWDTSEVSTVTGFELNSTIRETP